MLLRIILVAVGTFIVLGTMMSAITTIILPRGVVARITRVTFRVLRRPFDWVANERRSFEMRDRILALYGPIGLVALPSVWVGLSICGFTLVFMGINDSTLAEAYHLSGSSITTLGFAPAETALAQTVAFIEAGVGLFLVGLMISFLPSVYSSFSRRESSVALLATRAGSPPSALEFLIRHHRIGWLYELEEFWLAWERWFAELEESHTSFPALVFFRSPRLEASWVTAAGTMLDAAGLYVAAIDTKDNGPPSVLIRAGYIALRTIASFFGIEYEPDPDPSDPISITRQEFDDVCDELAEAGIPMLADRDQAWRDFAGWRVNYDTVLLDLAELVVAPYASWSSDRTTPAHQRPRFQRFITPRRNDRVTRT